GGPSSLCGGWGEVPGVIDAGESEVDQAAEVEGGGSGVEPGVVLDGAAVAQAPVAVVDEPGDGAFDRWPPAAVVGLPARIGGGLVAGGCLEVVVRADGQDASRLGFGAPLTQGASGA